MSLDLISSWDTRFFAEEISSDNITFDLENSLVTDGLLPSNHLTGDPMVQFNPVEMELTETEMNSDSDTSGSNAGLMDFNLSCGFDTDLVNTNCFPDLHDGISDDIKLEPISPLAQSPQPFSPLGNTFTTVLDMKPESQCLDTPPISPPSQSNSSDSQQSVTGAEIIKVITLDSSGNIQLPNGAKLMVAPSNGALHPVVPRASNIHPKPASTSPVVIKVVPPPTKLSQGQQPLILTQQNSEPVKTVRPVQARSSVMPKSITNLTTSINSNASNNQDAKAFKRQQRMIKNRESACLSRKKKKEYVTSLEATISDLNKENQKLRQENAFLRDRVATLEKGNGSFSINSNVKKTTALFAVLLVVSFNMAAIGNMVLSSKQSGSLVRNADIISEPSSVSHHGGGRTLLWNTDDDESLFETRNSSMSLRMCPMQINRTESSRINSELRGWFHAPNQPKTRTSIDATPAVPHVQSNPSKHELAKVETRPSMIGSTAYRKYLLSQNNRVHSRWIANNELQVYEALPDRYLFDAFFEAIDKKDDIFYVVSFSADHLLLPATIHNNTVRPRMSLLLPAIPLNETMQAPPHHVSMMQIDCEVTNTRLLHINEASIPPYYDGNRTSGRKAEANKAEAGKRTWRKLKKHQKKVDSYNAIYTRDSR